MIKFNINKVLLPMKGHYFLWNAGTGPVVPFLSTYARQLGFSGVVVGLIYTILPVSGMIAKPLAGYVVDYFKCQKKMLLAAQLLTAVAFLAVFYSPDLPLQRRVHFSCDNGEVVFDTGELDISECNVNKIKLKNLTEHCEFNCDLDEPYWNIISRGWNMTQYSQKHPNKLKFAAEVPLAYTEKFTTTIFRISKVLMENGYKTYPKCSGGAGNHISTYCDINCDSYDLNELFTVPAVKDSEAYSSHQFWVFLLTMILAWVGQAVVVSIGDAICFGMLGDQPNRYGYQRLFGSLGWGIFSTIAGFMIDSLSEGKSTKNFVSAFYLAAALLILDFIVSSRLQFTQQKISPSIVKDVWRLLSDARILVFLMWCICVGMCTGIIWNFLFWLIEDLAREKGCDSQTWIKTLEGLIQAVQCLLGELPFFFLSGWIIKRIGHVHVMSLVLLTIGIRYILYSVITNPWWFLPVELLNGLTFGLFYACMASYASIIAPQGTEATMQGLVGAVFEGLGVSLGSLLAGTLYETYGGPTTFRAFGIGALFACLLHFGLQILLNLKESQTRYASPKEAREKLQDEDQQELNIVSGNFSL